MKTADKHARPLTASIDTRPHLLIERKPAYRVFFSNVFDILLFRVVRGVAITSKPAPFWPDVFVQSATPWWGLTESAIWHVIMIGAVLILWRDTPLPEQRYQRTYEPVVYYDPPPTFTVEGSRRLPERAAPRQRLKPEAPAMRVARERTRSQAKSQGQAAPPDIKTNERGPNIAGSDPPLPSVPLSATARSQLNVPSGPTSVVAPAPDLQQAASGQATSRRPGLLQASVIPPAPDLGSVAGRRAGTGTAPSATVVGPPPTLRGAGRGLGTNNVDINIGPAQVVGPSPQLPMHEQNLGTGMGQGVLGSAASLAVPPAPSLRRSGNLAGGRIGSVIGGGVGSRVVPPPPSLPGASGSPGGRGVGALSGQGVQVVPPPPSVQGAGHGAGDGRASSFSGVGMQAVPPVPSIQGAGSRGGGGVVGSLSGVGTQVVPPPPSMEGAGEAGGGRAGLLSGTGMRAVPPPPTVQGAGGSGSGRLGSLSGTGSQVVPPPPSGLGAGGVGNGRFGSMSGTGSQVVPPPPSGLGAGGVGSGRIGSLSGDGSQIVPPPPSGIGEGSAGGGRIGALGSADIQGLPPPSGAGSGTAAGGVQIADNSPGGGGPGSPGGKDQPNDVDAQEMPVRLIGLALALPGSSYFSNYEVFIAERQLGKNESQFIKLVYISLPYQRRLSEYNPSHAKVYKLRVTRDKSCDETVQQMTQAQASDAQPNSPYAEALADLNSIDPNRKLPCYRTTADDYRRALSHSR